MYLHQPQGQHSYTLGGVLDYIGPIDLVRDNLHPTIGVQTVPDVTL